MNREKVEAAAAALGDVDACIRMVKSAIDEMDTALQVRAVQVLTDIFNSRYAALIAAIHGE
jgi:hypothetical protein